MKVIGIGLNKTGTKTLGAYLTGWGLRHRSFDLDAFQLYRSGKISELLELMQGWDSFEDWPWPLIWREVDEKFPEARFVLTVRENPERWYRSLCKMAVRMGPLSDFEQHIYGFAMPHGHRREHLDFYCAHNQAVLEHFRDRPGKLLKICWADPEAPQMLADFLGKELVEVPLLHENRSYPVYSGDNIVIAQAYRLAFQRYWWAKQLWRRMT